MSELKVTQEELDLLENYDFKITVEAIPKSNPHLGIYGSSLVYKKEDFNETNINDRGRVFFTNKGVHQFVDIIFNQIINNIRIKKSGR